MRLTTLPSIVLCCFATTLFAHAQNVAVNGIKLGMTLAEARAKLPAGLQVTMPNTGFPPQVTTLYAERIPFTADDVDNEAFTIEAVNGKVAYVKQIITYSPSKAPDRAAFQQSLIKTYGAPSPYPPDATPGSFPMWVWDRNGKLAPNGDSCPGGIEIANGAKGLYRPVMVASASGNPDLPGCHVVFFVAFDRRTDRIPYSKLDWVEYSLSDDSMFFAALNRTGTAKSQSTQ
jgi:hypothetical protein